MDPDVSMCVGPDHIFWSPLADGWDQVGRLRRGGLEASGQLGPVVGNVDGGEFEKKKFGFIK